MERRVTTIRERKGGLAGQRLAYHHHRGEAAAPGLTVDGEPGFLRTKRGKRTKMMLGRKNAMSRLSDSSLASLG